MAIRRQVGDRAGEGGTLNNIGGVYDNQGNYGEALRYYKQSLAIRRQVGDRAGEGTTLNNIGGVYRAQGNYGEALRYYEQSLAISRQVGDRAGEGITLSNIGATLARQENYLDALLPLNEAFNLFESLGLTFRSDSVKEWIQGVLRAFKATAPEAEYQQQCRNSSQATSIPLAELCPAE